MVEIAGTYLSVALAVLVRSVCCFIFFMLCQPHLHMPLPSELMCSKRIKAEQQQTAKVRQ